jgi:c-di-GMP phosphodiesterase
MAAPEFSSFPLVEMQAVSNVRNEWVALALRVAPGGEDGSALRQLFATPALLTAIAPLDCIVRVTSPAALPDSLLNVLPPNRVVLAMDAAALADEAMAKRMHALHEQGYRVQLAGSAHHGVATTPLLRAVALDCSEAAPKAESLLAMFGPHLALRVPDRARYMECVAAGFDWFAGPYTLVPEADPANDGTTRKRLLTLLGMLARDADSRELETQVKQDPALSYHLLKLVNSAAFALAVPITSFAHAINVLGRRQLQRWLQLLLYARQDEDGLANPLLPLAALRAARMESLSKLQGGGRDEQDLAYMVGVFALLDVLFGLPMTEIVEALALAPIVSDALLERKGPLGELLLLAEAGVADPAALAEAGIETDAWWESELQAFHWAIQVSRNL